MCLHCYDASTWFLVEQLLVGGGLSSTPALSRNVVSNTKCGVRYSTEQNTTVNDDDDDLEWACDVDNLWPHIAGGLPIAAVIRSASYIIKLVSHVKYLL